ncbi:SDR family NAD(P)-dependent oxidoreductase [Dactylosporangium sucinum]|nr:SDR family NAD(P)-dependent oxidoreductase [Dactylosporangium sucinum]
MTGRRVALVTGGSRGVGRGIATALGHAGWEVWITGRSSDAGGTSGHLPGTVEDVARAVDRVGGAGRAVVCDHWDDAQVDELVRRIGREAGRLDLLVNNVWGGYERLNAGGWEEWNLPFWEQPLELWDAMFGAGVRAHYVTTAKCVPLLLHRPGGLVVTVSMEVGAVHDLRQPVAYSVAKTADDRLALAVAEALKRHGVASVSLYPGLVRTEGVMQFAEYLDMENSQSPEGVGRAVVAVAADADVLAMSGRGWHVADLGARYGIDVS